MRKRVSLLSASSLLLLLNSCAWLPGSEQGQEPPSPRAKITSKPAFQPSAAAEKTATANRLIPSTNPAQRQQKSQKGRSNPFAILPAEPLVTLKPSTENSKGGTDGKPGTQTTPGAKGDPSLAPKQTAAPSPKVTYLEVPSPRVPNEARGVFVSGVINIGSSLVAIVKAPSEPFALQVTPGTLLSKGLVRVKAIDNISEIPSVTLEQYGTEVVRPVGQAPEPPLPQPPPKRIPIANQPAPVKTTSAVFSPR